MPPLVRRYEIGGLIARGGMAEIVAASAISEAGVSKRIVLKRIRTDRSADPAFVARFFDEARLAVQLSHANIVQVFDFGRTEDDEFFLAMELVEGVDLQRLRRAAGSERLPPAEALYVVTQVLRGLDYAHRRSDDAGRSLGIVHLDVKPANILLSFEGEVKLTDFGVARSRDARRPTCGISGTVPFMSPEQARGERVDARSDVFSAGVVLYTLLAGQCPFGEEDTERTLDTIRSANWNAPPRFDGGEVIEPLLARALAPQPDRRFPSAGAFADALEETLFTQAWRAGAAALRERIRAAFADERARLPALFAPGTRSEGLRVTRPASGRGATLLSRVPSAEPAARNTKAVMPPPPPRRRSPALPLAAAMTAMTTLGLFSWWMLSRPGRSPAATATAAAAPAVEPAQPANAAASESRDSLPMPAGEPTKPPAPAVIPTRSSPPAKPQPATGMLTVNASPWGTVSVNGRRVGTTPLIHYAVRSGTASVVVENPKLGRKTIQVKIQPKKETEVIVDLRSAPGLQ